MEYPTIQVPEGSTCVISGVVRERKGGPAIGSANISAATMRIDDLTTGNAIRAAGSITSDIDASGNLSTLITAAENAMITETRKSEFHVATIAITGTSGDAKTVNIVQALAIKIVNSRFE